ncbi:MAG: hypothetical protein QQM50_00325 [Dehalococcoides mccartyi]|uniref:Uncharacterized protein n=2 Tax=root TaxID=1 RepID=A0AB33HTB2_9CHLR|nr:MULTISPECIES: hypothetical protein [Dehalococcoides]MCF7635677.1 hypothetical protein [Dehalococcoides mccartyi]MDP4278981.1 hypothetical protein [Dehalococcoides mccartyi]MEA2120840.1 hypothetical protein [Dehalococcoides mccartyi]MEA2122676.1 hypothetical protein [Dehalococcoides mccartyi]POZ59815.1 hypothetical protein C1O63_0358 [Dehalococcoides mccartyi]
MEWYEILLIVVVLWAVIHTYMDMQIKKQVEKLQKEFDSHKH